MVGIPDHIASTRYHCGWLYNQTCTSPREYLTSISLLPRLYSNPAAGRPGGPAARLIGAWRHK